MGREMEMISSRISFRVYWLIKGSRIVGVMKDVTI
jgi:hypothetical protein